MHETNRRGRRTAGWTMALAAVLPIGVLAAGCASSTSDTASTTSTVASGGAATGTDASQGKLATYGPADDPTPQKGGKLVFGLEAEPDGLDTSRSRFAVSSNMVASAVYDPLVTIDDQGKTVPYLAESVTPNADFTEWTITLRPNVKFHDGTSLDAEALKVNFDYWSKSFITSLALTSLDSYRVTGPLTLAVKTTQPWAQFPYVLTSQVGYVAAPSFLENPDQTGPSMQPIGTGPFRYKDYVKGKSFTAERNPDYWQPELPYLDAIQFSFLPDSSARLQALENGDIDALMAYQPTVVQKVLDEAAAGDLKVVENSDGEEDVVTINTEAAPFDDLDVRRALALATDAAAWRAGPDKGVPYPATSPFAPGQLGYTTDDGFPGHDPAKAKELIDAYTARTGKPVEATYLATGNVDDMAEVQLLVDQWAQVGIKVEVVSVDQQTLIGRVVLGDYQLADWRNFGARDPDGDYLWWHSKSVAPQPKISPNVARYQDAEIDKALDDARGTDDQARRDRDYQVVAKRLNEGVAYLWLSRPVWVLAATPEVNGLYAAKNGSGVTLAAKTWLTKLWLSR